MESILSSLSTLSSRPRPRSQRKRSLTGTKGERMELSFWLRATWGREVEEVDCHQLLQLYTTSIVPEVLCPKYYARRRFPVWRSFSRFFLARHSRDDAAWELIPSSFAASWRESSSTVTRRSRRVWSGGRDSMASRIRWISSCIARYCSGEGAGD